MGDELELFDIDTTKKKKKKKKTTFEDFTSDDVPSQDKTATKTVTTEKKNPEADDPSSQTIESLENLDDVFSLKKKKKKKKVIVEEADPVVVDDEKDGEGEEAAVLAAEEQIEEDFSLTKKKKKKKATVAIDDNPIGEVDTKEEEEVKDDLDDDDDEDDDEIRTTWGGTDRDYTYQELLERVFEIMRAKNPDMVAGEKKRFVLKPPQVVRIGTKKTSFVNFTEICKMIHRQPKHLLAFLMAELGTSGSVDGNNMLIIKGRFQQRQIEHVLRRYIKEYVTCHTCRSPDTILQKETRLFFLQCEKCGSRCSVASIKSGFQAMTGKRAAARAKQH
ncbi:eukaryotic translation initiation factor 2 subunit 2-like [Oscarella lobularis]|uniref:eukaryotic translation initiation factor 2 subunit 2-like n=1 Tax=Oscarella lobularis TaxID=121494 RepID=UPI0033133628